MISGRTPQDRNSGNRSFNFTDTDQNIDGVVPPGTESMSIESFHPTEDYYFSIFKWTEPLQSALDIKIDEDFIYFLRDGHTRKEFNKYYQGYDNDYLKAPSKAPNQPLPLGNHVISVCLAAGIIQKKPASRFFLRADWLQKKPGSRSMQ